LLAVDCIATETSEGACTVDEACKVRSPLDTDDRDDDTIERALLLGRCQPPGLLVVDGLTDDTRDGVLPLVARGIA
jgi:hypothetical protein